MAKKIPILILVTQMEPAGAQKVAISQARYFHNKGYKVTLCFFYDKGNYFRELELSEPYRLINLKAKNPNSKLIVNFFNFFRALGRLFSILKNEKITIIETISHYSNIIGIPLAWLCKVPIRISSQRSMLVNYPFYVKIFDYLINNFGFSTKMIAVSDEVRLFCINVEKIRPERVIVIKNGVEIPKKNYDLQNKTDFQITQKLPISTKIILTVGRLTEIKGHTFLIKAAEKIINTNPEVIFLIVGEGYLFSDLQKEINSRNMEEKVKLCGLIKDIRNLYEIADIFVLPSLSEGMSNSLLEAMSHGIPVIASNVGGNLELISHNETGILIPPGSEDELAKALKILIKEDNLAKTLGKNARDFVEKNYSLTKMCSEYEELFTTLIRNKFKI